MEIAHSSQAESFPQRCNKKLTKSSLTRTHCSPTARTKLRPRRLAQAAAWTRTHLGWRNGPPSSTPSYSSILLLPGHISFYQLPVSWHGPCFCFAFEHPFPQSIFSTKEGGLVMYKYIQCFFNHTCTHSVKIYHLSVSWECFMCSSISKKVCVLWFCAELHLLLMQRQGVKKMKRPLYT